MAEIVRFEMEGKLEKMEKVGKKWKKSGDNWIRRGKNCIELTKNGNIEFCNVYLRGRR